jgi:hypothetical protein
MACTPISLSAWIEAKLKATKGLAQRLLRDLAQRRDIARQGKRVQEWLALQRHLGQGVFQEKEEPNCHHMSSLEHEALFYACRTVDEYQSAVREVHALRRQPAVPPYA